MITPMIPNSEALDRVGQGKRGQGLIRAGQEGARTTSGHGYG